MVNLVEGAVIFTQETVLAESLFWTEKLKLVEVLVLTTVGLTEAEQAEIAAWVEAGKKAWAQIKSRIIKRTVFDITYLILIYLKEFIMLKLGQMLFLKKHPV